MRIFAGVRWRGASNESGVLKMACCENPVYLFAGEADAKYNVHQSTAGMGNESRKVTTFEKCVSGPTTKI